MNTTVNTTFGTGYQITSLLSDLSLTGYNYYASYNPNTKRILLNGIDITSIFTTTKNIITLDDKTITLVLVKIDSGTLSKNISVSGQLTFGKITEEIHSSNPSLVKEITFICPTKNDVLYTNITYIGNSHLRKLSLSSDKTLSMSSLTADNMLTISTSSGSKDVLTNATSSLTKAYTSYTGSTGTSNTSSGGVYYTAPYTVKVLYEFTPVLCDSTKPLSLKVGTTSYDCDTSKNVYSSIAFDTIALGNITNAIGKKSLPSAEESSQTITINYSSMAGFVKDATASSPNRTLSYGATLDRYYDFYINNIKVATYEDLLNDRNLFSGYFLIDGNFRLNKIIKYNNNTVTTDYQEIFQSAQTNYNLTSIGLSYSDGYRSISVPNTINSSSKINVYGLTYGSLASRGAPDSLSWNISLGTGNGSISGAFSSTKFADFCVADGGNMPLTYDAFYDHFGQSLTFDDLISLSGFTFNYRSLSVQGSFCKKSIVHQQDTLRSNQPCFVASTGYGFLLQSGIIYYSYRDYDNSTWEPRVNTDSLNIVYESYDGRQYICFNILDLRTSDHEIHVGQNGNIDIYNDRDNRTNYDTCDDFESVDEYGIIENAYEITCSSEGIFYTNKRTNEETVIQYSAVYKAGDPSAVGNQNTLFSGLIRFSNFIRLKYIGVNSFTSSSGRYYVRDLQSINSGLNVNRLLIPFFGDSAVPCDMYVAYNTDIYFDQSSPFMCDSGSVKKYTIYNDEEELLALYRVQTLTSSDDIALIPSFDRNTNSFKYGDEVLTVAISPNNGNLLTLTTAEGVTYTSRRYRGFLPFNTRNPSTKGIDTHNNWTTVPQDFEYVYKNIPNGDEPNLIYVDNGVIISNTSDFTLTGKLLLANNIQ